MRIASHTFIRPFLSAAFLCTVSVGLAASLTVGCTDGTSSEPEPDPQPAQTPESPEPSPQDPEPAQPDPGPSVEGTDGGAEQCPQLNPLSSPVGTACTTNGQTCPSCFTPGPDCIDLVCRDGVWTQGTVIPIEDAGTTDAGAGATDAGTTDAGAGATDAGTTDAGTADAGRADAGTTDAGADAG